MRCEMYSERYASAVGYNSIGEFSSDSYFARNPYFDEPNIKECQKERKEKARKKQVDNISKTTTYDIIHKGKIILSFVIVGIILILVVFMSAYAADIRNINNELEKENIYLQSEIDSLNIKIGEASKIEYIEDTAINDLGMIYPDPSKCIYVSDDNMPSGSLANLIKQEAYN